jgi:ribonuclease P protein 1
MYLFKTEKSKENRLQKKEELRIAREKHRDEVRAARASNSHINYGLSQNTFLLKVYERTMDMWGYHKMANAMKFGQPLVIDVGYDDCMKPRETKACAEQLLNFIATNRANPEPFHLRKHVQVMTFFSCAQSVEPQSSPQTSSPLYKQSQVHYQRLPKPDGLMA